MIQPPRDIYDFVEPLLVVGAALASGIIVGGLFWIVGTLIILYG